MSFRTARTKVRLEKKDFAMTLKEELEILRGEPIKVFEGDPKDIPCIETSDAEKLCKHPVVSVQMITYNHGPYIRQAIEGVMMQETDFEFELVIGEDASTDKTREICFEYQKKYPDKIRVLWWHENLQKLNHPAGRNGRRTCARCRGEFIALCEGDDYWIDPLKLQKQVDVMRKHPSVGYCVTGAKVKCEIPKDHPRLKRFRVDKWEDGCFFDFCMDKWPVGFVSQLKFWSIHRQFPRTASVMYRASAKTAMDAAYEISKWQMKVGDTTLLCGFASTSDAFHIGEKTAVYRLNSNGVGVKFQHGNNSLYIDSDIIDFYFSKLAGDDECCRHLAKRIFHWRIEDLSRRKIGRADWRKFFNEWPEPSVFDGTSRFWLVYRWLLRHGVVLDPPCMLKSVSFLVHPIRAFRALTVKK